MSDHTPHVHGTAALPDEFVSLALYDDVYQDAHHE